MKPHPGPWAVCQDPQNDQWHKGTTIYSVPLGQRVGDASVLSKYCEDNATLMASSPELLDALEGLVKARRAVTQGLERELYAKWEPIADQLLERLGRKVP